MKISDLNSYRRIASAALGALTMVALAGCASAPSVPVADGTPVASQKAAGVDDTIIVDGERYTPLSPEALQAAAADNFWNSGASATVDDDGNLIYTVAPPLVAGRTLEELPRGVNRLDSMHFIRTIDPVTGLPIVRQRDSNVRLRNRVSPNTRGVSNRGAAPRSTGPVIRPVTRSPSGGITRGDRR